MKKTIEHSFTLSRGISLIAVLAYTSLGSLHAALNVPLKIEGDIICKTFDVFNVQPGKERRRIKSQIQLVTDLNQWKMKIRAEESEGQYFEAFFDGDDTYFYHRFGANAILPGHGRGLEDVRESASIASGNVVPSGNDVGRILWVIYFSADYREKNEQIFPIWNLDPEYLPTRDFQSTGDLLNSLVSVNYHATYAEDDTSGRLTQTWLASDYQAERYVTRHNLKIPTEFHYRYYYQPKKKTEPVISAEYHASLRVIDGEFNELSYPTVSGRIGVTDKRFRMGDNGRVMFNKSNEGAVSYLLPQGPLLTRHNPKIIDVISELVQHRQSITIADELPLPRLFVVLVFVGFILFGIIGFAALSQRIKSKPASSVK
jgi:hypothetical protein